MKLREIINFLIKKIKYISNKNITLPDKASFPLSFELVIDKNAILRIGKEFKLNCNVSLRVRERAICEIGNGVFINNGCIITCKKHIKIGDNVLLGPNVMIFDHDHDYRVKDYKEKFKCADIIIEENCWIGANSTILKGTHIEKNVVIGAGSVVSGTIEENTVFYQERNSIMRKYEKED